MNNINKKQNKFKITSNKDIRNIHYGYIVYQPYIKVGHLMCILNLLHKSIMLFKNKYKIYQNLTNNN